MKKISIFLVVVMIIGLLPLSVFAETVETIGAVSEGVVTYSEDFQSYDATGAPSWVNDTHGIHYYAGGTGSPGKFNLKGNYGKYLRMQCTTASKYPYMQIYLNKNQTASGNASLINSLANAKQYKVKFKMRHIPTTETKNMELYLGSRYHFYTGTGAKAFNVLAKNADNSASITKVEGSIDSFAVDTATEGNNKFIEFEISVDTVAKSTAMKINGVETYKDVPQYVDSKQGPTSFDELKIRYNTATGTTDIDDIKVIVTDPAVCSSENWAEKTGIDFEDFGVGLIRASETENVGGFTNTHTEDNDFYSFINYSYDSESPQTIDKYLTITKNSTGNGGRSVKRDISAVTSNYSVYDLSFKIKNDLTGSTSTAIIKDGDGSKTAGGTAVGFTTTGTAFYFDYSQENAKVSLDQQLFAPGEWTPVKFRVYKNEDRADIYIGDMTTPVAEGVTTNYKFGGRSFVSAPQNSTMGSISVNDIAITGVEDDDYVFTYVAGSTDMSKFTSGRITAECKTAASVAKTPIVVVAEYNANGELDRIDVSGEIGEDGTVKAELSGVTAAEGKSVRLMLWDGYDSLKPLRKSVTLLPEITAAD